MYLSSTYTGFYYLTGGVYYYFYEIETTNFSPVSAIAIFITASILSAITTWYFTKKRAKKLNQKPWNTPTKQLVSTYSITFVFGTIYIIILAMQERYIELIPMVPLIYGLSLINASKHTKNILKPLGIIHVITAFCCLLFIELSFWFYTFSFAFIHIINGLYISIRHDKNK